MESQRAGRDLVTEQQQQQQQLFLLMSLAKGLPILSFQRARF